MSKYMDLLDDAKAELANEDRADRIDMLKERLRELRETKRVLERLEKQFDTLLATELDD